MRIICFGDSNTWGYDPRSYIGEQYPRNVRWQGRLAALPGLDVVNCGVNGRSIPNTPARISAACAEIGRYLPAETLVVMLGGNDLLSQPDFCAEDVAERMESFLRVALSELAPARTLLVSPPPMRPGGLGGRGAARHRVAAPGRLPRGDGARAGYRLRRRRRMGPGALFRRRAPL